MSEICHLLNMIQFFTLSYRICVSNLLSNKDISSFVLLFPEDYCTSTICRDSFAEFPYHSLETNTNDTQHARNSESSSGDNEAMS